MMMVLKQYLPIFKPKKPGMLNQQNERLTTLLQILLLLPFFALSLYVWPSSDDYYTASFLATSDHQGLWSMFRYHYFNWSGRYSMLLGALMSPAMVEHIWLYRIFVFASLTVLSFSLWWFWSNLIKDGKDENRGIVISALFLLLWLQLAPGISESFYWYSGVVVYIWPLAGLFFLWGGMLQNNNTLLQKVVWALVAFTVAGFNEMAAALVLITALLSVFGPGRRCWKKGNYLMLVSAGLGVFFLLASPGNWQRMELFDNSTNMWDALLISMVSLAKLNGIHLQSLSLWLIALLLFRTLTPDNFRGNLRYFLHLHPLLIAVLGQGLLWVLLFIPAWSMGINPPLRIYGFLSPLWLFWFGWLLISAGWHFRTKLPNWPVFSGAGFQAMVLLIALSFMVQFVKIPGGDIVFGGNVPQAWYDLAFRARDYNNQMNHRETIIQEAREHGTTQMGVPALVSPPGTIFFIDMTSDPNHWINALYARHYGMDELWIEPW
jgi:hypothetical protein